MEPVTTITGRATVYPGANVDTDEIIPARFLYRDRKDGFADTLFHDLRLDHNGDERPEFVLNKPDLRDPQILVAGQNFGCGSSREHAVWALLDSGIRCVVAVSFGDIFRNNAIENGLLPVVMKNDQVAALSDSVSAAAPCEMTVDLAQQTVRSPDGTTFTFDFEAGAKAALLAGFNSIDLTIARMDEIMTFEDAYRHSTAWIFEPNPSITTKQPS